MEDEKRSFVDVAKARRGRLGDVIWLQLGGRELRSREEQLGHCLVGRWGEVSNSISELAMLRSWRVRHWNLKRGLNIILGGVNILLEFKDTKEAERVLKEGFDA